MRTGDFMVLAVGVTWSMSCNKLSQQSTRPDLRRLVRGSTCGTSSV